MDVINDALCIKDWSVTAENGDHFEIKRGKSYTTSLPGESCAANGPGPEKKRVVVFSNYWVSVPVEYFSFPDV